MIPCANTHVIHHNGKHGDGVYRCTLANAKKLLASALEYNAKHLLTLEADLALKPLVTIRSSTWLQKALTEVQNMDPDAKALRRALHGSHPAKGVADTRPTVEITSAMRDELVLACYHHKLPLDQKSSNGISLAGLQILFEALNFLAPARERFPYGLRLIDDYLHEGLMDLRVLRADSWKDTAKEENIVGNFYIPFLTSWDEGRWSLMVISEA